MDSLSSMSFSSMDLCGNDLGATEPDERKRMEQRRRRGECERCGRKTHIVSKIPFGRYKYKREPLTAKGVLEGRCLRCRPLDNTQQPMVDRSPAGDEKEEKDEDTTVATMASEVSMDLGASWRAGGRSHYSSSPGIESVEEDESFEEDLTNELPRRGNQNNVHGRSQRIPDTANESLPAAFEETEAPRRRNQGRSRADGSEEAPDRRRRRQKTDEIPEEGQPARRRPARQGARDPLQRSMPPRLAAEAHPELTRGLGSARTMGGSSRRLNHVDSLVPRRDRVSRRRLLDEKLALHTSSPRGRNTMDRSNSLRLEDLVQYSSRRDGGGEGVGEGSLPGEGKEGTASQPRRPRTWDAVERNNSLRLEDLAQDSPEEDGRGGGVDEGSLSGEGEGGIASWSRTPPTRDAMDGRDSLRPKDLVQDSPEEDGGGEGVDEGSLPGQGEGGIASQPQTPPTWDDLEDVLRVTMMMSLSDGCGLDLDPPSPAGDADTDPPRPTRQRSG